MQNGTSKLMKERGIKGFWYEVGIDFDEDFEDAIYPVICDMHYDKAVVYCLQYMIKREAFYDSPRYYQMLDRMVADIKEEDLIKV